MTTGESFRIQIKCVSGPETDPVAELLDSLVGQGKLRGTWRLVKATLAEGAVDGMDLSDPGLTIPAFIADLHDAGES